MALRSFFPLRKSLVENENFKKMPPAHKLYFLLLISEYNLRGRFYQSDMEFAVTINTSQETIRRARRNLKKLGWLSFRPGFLENGKRPVATTYYNVAFSKVEKGEFFAPIHRYSFQALLYHLRICFLYRKEVLLFCYLCYFREKYQGEEEDFFISKKELRELTGMPGAPDVLLRFSQLAFFSDDAPICDTEDYYHKIKIVEYNEFADPEEDEFTRKRANFFREDIQNRLVEKKFDF